VGQQREIALELSSRQAMAARQEVLAAQQAAHEQAKAAHEAASKLGAVSGLLRCLVAVHDADGASGLQCWVRWCWLPVECVSPDVACQCQCTLVI
jgi:hypothetical protein